MQGCSTKPVYLRSQGTILLSIAKVWTEMTKEKKAVMIFAPWVWKKQQQASKLCESESLLLSSKKWLLSWRKKEVGLLIHSKSCGWISDCVADHLCLFVEFQRNITGHNALFMKHFSYFKALVWKSKLQLQSSTKHNLVKTYFFEWISFKLNVELHSSTSTSSRSWLHPKLQMSSQLKKHTNTFILVSSWSVLWK